VNYSEYDLQGRLKTVSHSHTLTRTWDALGRNRSETSFVGTMSYSYDAAGRRTQTTWPDGFYVTQDFYETGEVRTIRENGATSGVGVLATYTFDNLGRRSAISRGNGTGTSYGYDAVSRLASLSQDLAASAHDVTTTLTYNPASQIATYSRNNDGYAWAGHYNVNRTYAINGLNQITAAGSAAVSHDQRGNTLTLDGISFDYSSENRLETVVGMGTLSYDATGRLMYTTPGVNRRYQYDGADMSAEYNDAYTLLRRYVHGPGADEPVVWYEGVGTADRRWLHQDERGSVVAITDNSGAMLAINSYDEYGVPSVANVGAYGYTGQVWIPQIRMNYYKARMYAPAIGRFMQTDPIGYSNGVNWYTYVGNDPLSRIDPTGLSWEDNDVEYIVREPQNVSERSPFASIKINTIATNGQGGIKIVTGALTSNTHPIQRKGVENHERNHKETTEQKADAASRERIKNAKPDQLIVPKNATDVNKSEIAAYKAEIAGYDRMLSDSSLSPSDVNNVRLLKSEAQEMLQGHESKVCDNDSCK
jgi:RHS repeat-associated protein